MLSKQVCHVNGLLVEFEQPYAFGVIKTYFNVELYEKTHHHHKSEINTIFDGLSNMCVWKIVRDVVYNIPWILLTVCLLW